MSANMKGELDEYELVIPREFEIKLMEATERITTMERIILANDPARNLHLGYWIARRNGKIVKSVKGFKEGDRFDLQLSDGIIEGQIKSEPDTQTTTRKYYEKKYRQQRGIEFGRKSQKACEDRRVAGIPGAER